MSNRAACLFVDSKEESRSYVQDGSSIGLELGVGEGTIGVVGCNVGIQVDSLGVLFDGLLVLLVCGMGRDRQRQARGIRIRVGSSC